MIFWTSIKTILLIMGVLFFLIMIYTAIISFKEREKRAVVVSLFLSLLLPAPFLIVALLQFSGQTEIGIGILGIILLLFIILFFPYRKRMIIENDVSNKKVDERDIMFARDKLISGTTRFEEYYRMKPENKLLDEKFREKPGLMSPESVYYDPLTFSSADASFRAVECFKEMIEGEPAKEKHEFDNIGITRYIKQWAIKLGALDVGVTELKDYHLYSHKGRGDRYGQSIKNNHKYAIAFTVEMNKEMLDCAPYGPTLMESAQQYFNSGAIAVQVAEFIRNLGYPATAHIDGNYELICPLVARDAGLGEIGRMGLLMTPNLGPRIRISVVTTDLTLIQDKCVFDHTVLDFCKLCKKCANVCPARAISFDNREEIDEAMRWKINSEACYTYWCTVGTDCGKCMSICPYSHPDNLLHNFIRWGIRNNPIFRLFALKMDDLFYGR